MYLSQTVIAQGDGLTITSYGNGAAYRFANELEGRAVFLQGEEAIDLRLDIERLETGKAAWSTGTILDYLWSAVGYGDAADPVDASAITEEVYFVGALA